MPESWRRLSSLGVVMTLLLVVACHAPVSPPVTGVPTAAEAVPRISVQELKERLDAGASVIVIDARPYEDYAARHISGAISMPLADVSSRYDELPRTEEIVFYCT
jgi:3-mercaptopyruvate sulfurtransferase SseA